MNDSSCVDGHNELIFGTPTPVTFSITIPAILIGISMNSFVLYLLIIQKQPKTNQEIYVLVLAIFGWIMIGPCFTFTVYANWVKCYTAPQLVTDFRIFLSQLSAGMNVWLVFLISLDRLLMVIYRHRYPLRETRSIVISKLIITFAFYTIICGCINFSAYFLDRVPFDVFSANPTYQMVFSFKAWPNSLSRTLNIARMFTDRAIPYVLCTSTYAAVLILRIRRKTRIHPEQENGEETSRKRVKAEERYRRSGRLVIGVGLALFIALGPETVMDVSEYAFDYPLRVGPYRIIGVLWYLQNLSNPAIYILALPTLRLKAGRTIKKILIRMRLMKDKGKMCNDRDSIRTIFGTSVQLQRTPM